MRAVLVTLRDFLAAVGSGNHVVLESFFAEDVIYTGSNGLRMDKAAVMNSIGSRTESGSRATCRAEDITAQAFENTVIVNFRMVMDEEDGGRLETTHFRNTGTFLKRNGKWQAAAWHTTRLPDMETR